MEFSSVKLKKPYISSYISGGNLQSLKIKQKNILKAVSSNVFSSLYNSKS